MKKKAADRPSESETVAAAIAEFPEQFGLRAYPGKVFTISPSASYVSDEGVQLYLGVMDNGKWQGFVKGTADELRRQICKVQS